MPVMLTLMDAKSVPIMLVIGSHGFILTAVNGATWH